jgi:hypothetical protein
MAKQSAKKQAEAAAAEEEAAPATAIRVTVSLQDGTTRTETQDESSLDRIPVKGESFEYTHTETRTGQVVRVERIDEEGNVEQLTATSDVAHEIIEPETGDDLALDEVLAADEVEPDTEEALAANTEVGSA